MKNVLWICLFLTACSMSHMAVVDGTPADAQSEATADVPSSDGDSATTDDAADAAVADAVDAADATDTVIIIIDPDVADSSDSAVTDDSAADATPDVVTDPDVQPDVQPDVRDASAPTDVPTCPYQHEWCDGTCVVSNALPYMCGACPAVMCPTGDGCNWNLEGVAVCCSVNTHAGRAICGPDTCPAGNMCYAFWNGVDATLIECCPHR